MVILKGMTWDHPRGVEPLLACSKVWAEQTGVQIQWDKRSLQDFEAYPVQELARRYDLIVVDHPHVGQVTAENCLHPLEGQEYQEALQALKQGSVGQSLASYDWQGHQWALPIDAAAQVQAWRADRLESAAQTWDEMIALAQRGLVICPMRPPHSLMTLYTLAMNAGCRTLEGKDGLFAEEELVPIVEQLKAFVRLLPQACWEMDPIAVLELMSQPDSPYVCAPYIYGYVNYAYEGFRAKAVTFADIPVAEKGALPKGSALGGTGIAVSALSKQIAEAKAFAYWVASGEVQRTCFALHGGQPGHALAWADATVNQQSGDFYRNTRQTLEHAWVRPRHHGYMGFQQQSSAMLNHALQNSVPALEIVRTLNALYKDSFVVESV